MPKVEAIVKADLLVWARESAALSLEQAAKKASVKLTKLQSWENGKARPTVIQLRKLAHIYKRPLSVFYLTEPPKDFQPMHDFRRFSTKAKAVISSELIFDIRQMRDRRSIALELYEASIGVVAPFLLKTSLNNDPEVVGRQIRSALKITFEDQVGWSQGYESLNRWRTAIEAAGVLVFQSTDVSLDEMRGFSISDEPLPAIVLNIKDAPNGRIFTMLHELTHIMLRRGGVCDLSEDGSASNDDVRVEIFCNAVAAATLVPSEYFLIESQVKSKKKNSQISDEEVEALAAKYGASKQVILRRFLNFGFISKATYQTKQDQYVREYVELRRTIRKGFAPPHRLALSSSGPTFTQLVLSNYYQDKITASDVSDFLSIRLKHLPKIEAELSHALRSRDVA